jgi:hypothetical protein
MLMDMDPLGKKEKKEQRVRLSLRPSGCSSIDLFLDVVTSEFIECQKKTHRASLSRPTLMSSKFFVLDSRWSVVIALIVLSVY